MVGVGQYAVLVTHHAKNLWTVGVLCHFDDIALVGHLLGTVHAKRLSLQFVAPVAQECYFLLDGASLRHWQIALLLQVGDIAPLLDDRPCVCTLSAVAQAQAFQPFVLTVQS